MSKPNAFAAQRAAALDFQPLPYMQEYIDELISEGRKPGHIRLTRAALHHFTEHMRTQGVVIPDDITRQKLVIYQGWVNQQKWALTYRIELLKKVRSWLNWMVNVGYLPTSPWVAIRTANTRKKPNPLSDEEMEDLFARHRQDAFGIPPFAYHRRELMLVLLFGWGLRVHELIALDLDDMDPSKGFVRAINKGGTYKSLPYLDEMKQSYRRWLGWRARHSMEDEPAVFIGRRGARMTEGDVWEVVHSLGERAGVRVHPHRFRDTCATHLLNSDMAVERVMMIMGHKHIKTTLGYGAVQDHKVAEALDDAMSDHLKTLIFGRTRDLMPLMGMPGGQEILIGGRPSEVEPDTIGRP